ncbi:MAG: flagellar hook-length control protein FliK [Burkholderiaceae bacterium]
METLKRPGLKLAGFPTPLLTGLRQTMGISATHLDSLSVIATPEATGGGASRPKGPPPADPQAAEFRRLFARVFGQQMRQEPAGGAPATAQKSPPEGQEGTNPVAARTLEGTIPEGSNPEGSEGGHRAESPEEPTNALELLRSLQIGKATQIITAGPPLAEEDLVRFAREAGLDEASIAALLIAQNEMVGLPPGGNLGLEANPEESPLFIDPVALPGSPQSMAAAPVLNEPLQTNPSPYRPAGFGPPIPPLSGVNVSALSEPSAGQAIQGQPPPGLGLVGPSGPGTHGPSGIANPGAAAFAVTVSTPESAIAQPLATSAWVQSRTGESVGPPPSLPKVDSGPPQVAIEADGLSPDGMGKEGFPEKGVTLRLEFQNLSVKERLMKLLGPEAVRAAKDSYPQGVRLESISLLDQPLLPTGAGLEPSAPQTSGLSSAASATPAASLGSGMGSGGQGAGAEGGRPDTNAQSGQARGLPQQVMQRFGELLGQRLLQQVSQGNWRVELDLEPGDLGSIRIELELRKGEIEASIKASQLSTRELLQESLPRLRETLERNGMDVASLSVGQQDRRQSDGQSSSGRNSSGQRSSADQLPEEVVAGSTQSPRPGDGRLDVWA